MTEKNLRILGREGSPNRQSSIHEIIDELHAEITRGKAVYSADELQMLERKLADYQWTLQKMLEP